MSIDQDAAMFEAATAGKTTDDLDIVARNTASIIPEIPAPNKEFNYVNSRFFDIFREKLSSVETTLDKGKKNKAVKLALSPMGIYSPLDPNNKQPTWMLKSRAFKTEYTVSEAAHVKANPELTMLFLNDIVDKLVAEFMELVLFEDANTIRFGGIAAVTAIDPSSFQPKIGFKIRYDLTNEAI